MTKATDRHPDRVYMGIRRDGDPLVWVAWPGGGRWLKAKHRPGRWNHGGGLEWGYGGSGPAQLALELLLDACQDLERAERWHQPYKWAVVSGLPRIGWSLHREAVLAQLEELEASDGGQSAWQPDDIVTLADVWDGSLPAPAPCPQCRGRGELMPAGDNSLTVRPIVCPGCGGSAK